MEYMNSEEIEVLWFGHSNDWLKKGSCVWLDPSNIINEICNLKSYFKLASS